MNYAVSLTGSLLATGAIQPQMMLASLLGWGAGIAIFIILIALIIFMLIVFWRLFKKAGYNGYESLISGHNLYVYINMAGKQGWYFFLFLIPYAIMMLSPSFGGIGAIIGSALAALGFIYLYVDLTFSFNKRFSKSTGFGFGLLFLPIIFYPILAFGKSKYSTKK